MFWLRKTLILNSFEIIIRSSTLDVRCWTLIFNFAFADDFGSLPGRWQRVDGGYVIEVRQIQADGQMEVGYYNPRPINVARAQASLYGDKIKIEVELRDKGYPGSAYTLIYAPDKDALFGYYYHAPTRQNLDVVFVRRK